MNTPPKASFYFDSFFITSFSFNMKEDEEDGVAIKINPSGRFISEEKTFEETLQFFAYLKSDPDAPVITATLIANFVFNEPIGFESIPPYFYQNSIAIVFPYLRAFVSNMTLQANLNPLILPVLNLSGLDKVLRENTTSE